MELEKVHEPEIENIFDTEQFVDTNTNRNLSNIVEEFSTPDLNGPESNISNDVLPNIIEEPSPVLIDEVLSTPTKKIILEVITEATANKAVSTIFNNEKAQSIPPTSPSPCVALSADILPVLDDDPVLLSTENPQTSDAMQEDCIIIVPCSDDEEEDDIDDDDLINDIKNSIIANNIDTKIIESSLSLTSVNASPALRNPSLTRGKLEFLFFLHLSTIESFFSSSK